MDFRITPRLFEWVLGSTFKYFNSVTSGGQPTLNQYIFLKKLAHNGLPLKVVGDFEALNCLPPLNLNLSTKLHLTTEPPISCRCCYAFVVLSIV